MGFPIITEEIQEEFERNRISDNVPNICGIHGRACRKMDNTEGANSVLCLSCELAKFAKTKEEK